MSKEEGVSITMVKSAFYDSYNCCNWIESKRKTSVHIFFIADILAFYGCYSLGSGLCHKDRVAPGNMLEI